MKRLITLLNGSGRRCLMALLMLCAVSMCRAGGYIHLGESGTGNWPDYKLTWDGNIGTVSINLTAGKTYEFLFKDTGTNNDKEVWYKFSNSPRVFTETTTDVSMGTGNQGNGKIEVKVTGAYIFKVEWKGEGDSAYPCFSLTYPKAISTSPADYTLHSTLTTPAWSDIAFDSEGKATVNLETAGKYPFVIQDTNGVNYANSGTMTYTDHTNWDFKPNTITGSIAAIIAGTYTFTIDLSGYNPVLSVEFPVVSYYISSNGVKVRGVFSESEIHFTLPASCYKDGALSFSISKKTSDGVTTYFSADGTEFASHSQNAAGNTISGVTVGEENEVLFTYTTPEGSLNDDPDDEIDVIYDISDHSLTLNYESRQNILDYAYYLIVPNENVGNTNRALPDWEGVAPAGHKAFRLFKGRERNSEDLNADLVSLNLKIDGNKGQQLRYDSNGEIRFYIQDGNGNKFFQPEDDVDDIYVKPGTSTGYTATARNGVDAYATRNNDMGEKNDRYYIISTRWRN